MNDLRAQVYLHLGEFTLDVAFEAPVSGVVCVLGPSGCGKTTLLRCIAGLQHAPFFSGVAKLASRSAVPQAPEPKKTFFSGVAKLASRSAAPQAPEPKQTFFSGVAKLASRSAAPQAPEPKQASALQTGNFLSMNGEVWQDDAQRVFVPTHRRAVAYVFQEPSLFEHLTVRQNIEYGLKRVPRAQRRLDIEHVVDWLGVRPLLARAPDMLSGGEKQRVAIARALVTSPKLLLMDEPLSALDEASRAEILPYLARLHEQFGIPTIYVSHNLREVARLADHLLCMEAGTITEAGPAAAVLESRLHGPWSSETETGFLTVTIRAHDDHYHLTEVDSPFGTLHVPRLDTKVGERVRVHISARDISVAWQPEPHSSILNQIPARILSLEPREPGQVILALAPPDSADGPKLFARITRKSCDDLALAPGRTIIARIKGVNLTP